MTEAEARAEIEILTEAAAAPTLSEDELRLLVRKAQRADSSQRAPSDDLWEPTWNIPFAVALGWKLKAGKLVGAYDTEAGPQKFKRSQFRQHCLDQAKQWQKQAAECALLPGGWTRRTVRGETNGLLPEDVEYLD